MRRAALATLLIGALLFAGAGSAQTPVENSVHNLGVTGPGPVKSSASAANDPGVCIFCHVPHNGVGNGTPLWNKAIPPDQYTLYQSTTYKQTNNPISQSSKLCLSCHDGTIALGQTVATGDLNITQQMRPDRNLGTDLSKDHPISFNLPAIDDGELKAWIQTSPLSSPNAAVKLYSNKVECLTCHDPHVPDKDPVSTKFLVTSNQGSALCLTCHDNTRGDLAGYSSGQHAIATNNLKDTSTGPYSTVAGNGCLSCHSSHNVAGAGPRLLRGVEENACLSCHGNNSPLQTAAPNIQAVYQNSPQYQHPTMTVTGVHDAAEQLPVNTDRHAECEDCHNSHVAQARGVTAPVAPAVPPPLMGAHGVSSTGAALKPATNEYEVCFQCHAGSPNKPQKKGYDVAYGRTAWRQSMPTVTDAYNTAEEFKSLTVQVSHNVIHAYDGALVPSLRDNMIDLKGNIGRSLKTGNLYCSDCHNSDQARSDGGLGPSGAHASQYQHLLERRYDVNVPGLNAGDPVTTVDYTTGPSGAYALCDKCHDVDGQLINGSDLAFNGLHKRHVQQDKMACSSCHSAHGIQGGDSNHHGNLIDPDLSIVLGAPVGSPDSYINTSTKTCSLTCHGAPHVNVSYVAGTTY